MSRNTWFVSSRFAVRNGLRLASSPWSLSLATQSPGSTRESVWFSSDKRNGPGRNSTVSVGVRSLSRTSVRFWRSRVGSPLTSRKRVAWVTGSRTITNSAGNCSERIAFSRGGSSTDSRTISWIRSSKLSGTSIPEPQNTCRKYSLNGSSLGSCAEILRTRRLTVNVTSTISSRIGVYPDAHQAQAYSSLSTLFNVVLESSTPPQPGHNTFQDSSKIPSLAACRKAATVRSSSSPVFVAKSSTLMRQSARSGAVSTSFSIASTASGSADWCRTENRFLASLIVVSYPAFAARSDPARRPLQRRRHPGV